MVAGMTAAPDDMPDPSRKRPVLGVSVCVWRGDEVLMIRRGSPPSKGLWAPVGGKVEWGETLVEAARREVHEETGIDCDIAAFSQLRELVGVDNSHHVVLAVFSARWRSGEPVAGDDADQAEWASVDRLAHYELDRSEGGVHMGLRRVTSASLA
eukprot:gene25394-27529_t